MSDTVLKMDAPDFREIIAAAKLMMLPPAQKRRYLSRVGRMAIAQAKRNVMEQKTIRGTSMAPRKKDPPPQRAVYHGDGSKTYKKTRPEMLFDLTKGKTLGMKMISPERAELHFFKNSGRVAFKHQYGVPEKFERELPERLFTKEQLTPWSEESKQFVNQTVALELIRCGVRQRLTDVKSSWKNYQAAAYLSNRKKGWDIHTPARPFLGASREQQERWGSAILRDLHGKFRAKHYQSLLD